MIDNVIKKISLYNVVNDDNYYLLENIDNNNGFFMYNDKICFVSKNTLFNRKNIYETKQLVLMLNYFLESAPSTNEVNTFENNNYNFLIFNNSKDDDLVFSFLELCLYFVKGNEPNIRDFFEGLSVLFSDNSNEILQNTLGIAGELSLIILMYEKFQVNIANHWNINGEYSKHDFTFIDFNIEVKSSITRNTKFIIKHDQLFIDKSIFPIVLNMSITSKGLTIRDMINKIKSYSIVSDLNFKIRLEKLLSEYTSQDKYSIVDFSVYSNKTMETIANIPRNISGISYDYDFSNDKTVPINALITKIKREQNHLDSK